MLDSEARAAIQQVVDRCHVSPGFYSIVAPEASFDDIVIDLSAKLKIKGTTPFENVDAPGLTAAAVDAIAAKNGVFLCLRGRAQPGALRQIELRRSDFISRHIGVIFLVTPLALRELEDHAPSVLSLLTGNYVSVGAQRILDAMGQGFVGKLLSVLRTIDENQAHLDKVLDTPRKADQNALVILRRWNSFSPIMDCRPIASIDSAEGDIWRRIRRDIRGGGYYFRWNGCGIAVDPGHNFIENMYDVGYSIADIDVIVISHDHLDHTADFEAILDLLYQRNKRTAQRISVYLNPTMYAKHKATLEMLKKSSLLDKHGVIDAYKGAPTEISPQITLYGHLAQHVEIGGADKALSLRFELIGSASSPSTSIGFTGDTGWHPGLASFFSGITVLVPHIGSIKRYELDEARMYKTHLGILGLFKLLEEITRGGCNPLVVISEFGEELRGIRDLIGAELRSSLPGLRIFPGDIGHTVLLDPAAPRVVCNQEGKCSEGATVFFEQDGRIRVCCDTHKPTLGTI